LKKVGEDKFPYGGKFSRGETRFVENLINLLRPDATNVDFAFSPKDDIARKSIKSMNAGFRPASVVLFVRLSKSIREVSVKMSF